MRTLHPSRTWYILFGIGLFLLFMLGAAAWHVLINADPLDCAMKGVICLFIPDRSDWYVHLISYGLMAPLMISMFLWFNGCRRQWGRLNMLTRNLATLTIKDDKLEMVARRLDLKEKVHLFDSDDYLCFCACFVSPRIYVSSAVVETLTIEELEALLLHEKYHLKNYDPLKILLGELIVSTLFLMPVLKDLFKRYLIRKEIAADEHAISYQGHRRGVIRTLKKLLEKQSSIGTGKFAVSGTEALKYRIDYLAGRKNSEQIPRLHVALSFVAPVILTSIILASLTVLHP